MAHVPVINHPDHQHNFRTEQEEHEIQEHLKEVAEEAREEEGDVNPNDVHPILWQIYNIASIAQPILFVFYLLLMSLIIRRLVIDPGTFAFNDVLTNALIEENWDAAGEKTFADISSKDDFYLWMTNVVTPALAPPINEHISDTYNNYHGAETIDGMVNLFVPPELMQHRSKYSVLPFHVGNDKNKIDEDMTNWMTKTSYNCSEECTRYCIRTPSYVDTGKPPVYGRKYTADPYPSKGFVMYLPIIQSPKNLNFTEILKHRTACTVETLNFYRQNGWIDRKTRMVELSVCAAPFTSTAVEDFGTYETVDAVACFNLNFEINRYGAWLPKYTISSGTSFANPAYRGIYENFVRLGSIIPAVIMLALEFNEMLVRRFAYFSFNSFWNYLDIIISVMAITFAGRFQIDIVHSLSDYDYSAGEATQLGKTMVG